MKKPIYSADTSSLLSSLKSFYPIANFPRLWQQVDDLIRDGRFLISEEVAVEAQKHDDGAAEWVKARHAAIVVPTDNDVAAAVRGILGPYPKLVKDMKNRNRADPFVIAVAQLRGAVVVTEENSRGSLDRPKIPLVCSELGLECITFYELIQREGWTF